MKISVTEQIDKRLRDETSVQGQIRVLQGLADYAHQPDGRFLAMPEIIALLPRILMVLSTVYEELCCRQGMTPRDGFEGIVHRMISGEGDV